MVTNLLSFFNFLSGSSKYLVSLELKQSVSLSLLSENLTIRNWHRGRLGRNNGFSLASFHLLLNQFTLVNIQQWSVTLPCTPERSYEKKPSSSVLFVPPSIPKNPFNVVKILPYGRHGDKGPPKPLVCPLCKRTGEFLFIEISFLKQRKPFIQFCPDNSLRFFVSKRYLPLQLAKNISKERKLNILSRGDLR